MSFKEFYNMMCEGGNAVASSPIEQKYIAPTLNKLQSDVLNIIGLKKRGVDWELLGSAGKKSTPSSDLDIAINTSSLMKFLNIKTTDDLVPKLIQLIKGRVKEFKFSPGINVFSFSFPIVTSLNESIKSTQQKALGLTYKGWSVYKDKKDNSFEWNDKIKKFVKVQSEDDIKYVQVDLMMTDNLEFTTWAYFSPTEKESRFKKMGLYRNILLLTLVSNVKRDVLDKFEDGSSAKERRLFLDLSKGIGTKTVSYVGKNNKPVKNPTVLDREYITKMPSEIVKLILGKNAVKSDVNSFESIWKKINEPDIKSKINIKFIASEVKKALEKLELPVPEELNAK